MDLQPNKTDGVIKPITNTRISASEWNQLVGSCMEFITEAGFTPDAEDNAQFLDAFKAIAANLELVGANTNLSNLTATGEGHFAKPDFSNVTATHIIETSHNGTEWYRVWSDGFCEQGGITAAISANSSGTVTFSKEFTSTDYSMQLTIKHATLETGGQGILNYAATSTQQATIHNGLDGAYTIAWEAKGYIS